MAIYSLSIGLGSVAAASVVLINGKVGVALVFFGVAALFFYSAWMMGLRRLSEERQAKSYDRISAFYYHIGLSKWFVDPDWIRDHKPNRG